MAHRIESYKIKNTRAFNSFQFNSFLHVTNLELMPAKLQQHLKVCILYDVVVRFMKIVIICNACTFIMFCSVIITYTISGSIMYKLSTGAYNIHVLALAHKHWTVHGKHFEE